ncbi:Alpha beta-hydrolase [Mycena indigotica]|uniref:Alpha beta-hydrolase n=1 Tax=Mycena indigotica TaxID=2126181 RepID=A0A8H6SAZ9_9AGAR|nr:Alpha beta-hydrolase [Mycena indigotica]KAF7295406.1 Alpha beta-hydrolase [Mycena indigotica]
MHYKLLLILLAFSKIKPKGDRSPLFASNPHHPNAFKPSSLVATIAPSSFVASIAIAPSPLIAFLALALALALAFALASAFTSSRFYPPHRNLLTRRYVVAKPSTSDPFSTTNPARPVKSVSASGRPLRRAVACFGNIATILYDAQMLEKDPYDDDETIRRMFEEEEYTLEEEDKFLDQKRADERNYEANLLLHHLLPGLAAKKATLAAEDLNAWIQTVQRGANTGRAEDFGKVTKLVANWINDDISKNVADICAFDYTPAVYETNEHGDQVLIKKHAPYLVPDDRRGRGTKHDITGALLSSVEVDWADESTRQKIDAGRQDFAPNYYVRALYAGFRGDPNDVEKGFLKSRYLLRTVSAIFLTSTEVEDGDDDSENQPPAKKPTKKRSSTRKTCAELAGLNGKITGRAIAYGAVQLYLSLTTVYQWAEVYGGVSLPQMYDFLVDYFEEPAPNSAARKRVDDLLQWWNTRLFKTHAASASTYRPSRNSRAALRAQRAALEPSNRE